MITTKQLLVEWANLLSNRKNTTQPHHFILVNDEFIGALIDHKFNGIMIDHDTNKHYEIKGLYQTTINEGLEPNKREITVTINFEGIPNSKEE